MYRVATFVLIGSLWASSLAGQTPERIAPFNLVKVNTPRDEDEPFSTVATNGTGQLYYTSKGELHVAQKNEKGWSPGKPYTEFEERGDYRSVFVAFPKTGTYPQTIFYATNADRSKSDGRGDNFDIYLRVKQNGTGADFNVAVPIHAISTPDDEMHPWLTADGKLYFSRKTMDGWRVLVSQRPKPDSQFEKPILLDLPAGQHHPTLSPDGRTMYLQGTLANGRWAIYRSFLVDGKWSKPEELSALNHPDAPTGNRSPSLSRNGAFLFFASDRPNGKGGLDIWYVPTDLLKKK